MKTDFSSPVTTAEFSKFAGILSARITTNKASGGDGIPVELFQILKDNAVKVLYSIMSANVEYSAVATGLEKVSFIPIPKKGNAKECSNYRTVAPTSPASKVMLKILQARVNSMWTVNFQMFKLVFKKAEEPEIKLPMSAGLSKKQESSRKTSTSALLTMPKPLTIGSQ